MVNHLLHKNRKAVPKLFDGRKLFKNVTLQKFYLGDINNKNFLIWCNVNFVSIFTAFNYTKRQSKFNITPYGEMFH